MPRTPTTAVLTLAAFATGVAADRFLFHSPATGQSSLNPSANAPVITNNTPLSEEQSPPGAPFSSSLDDLRTLVDPSSSHHAGNRVHRALDNASASDLQNLISKLASSGSPADRTLRTTLYHRLAGLDPTAALGSLLAEDDHLLKTSAIHGIFNSLARTDLNAAKAALASIENPELRRRALHGMAEAVGHASPHSFANYLTTVPDGHHLSDFFHMWSLRDPDAAIAFVANTADPTQRDHWSHGIGRGLALQDPALAIDWLSTLDPGQSSFRSSAEPAIEILAQTDPRTRRRIPRDPPRQPPAPRPRRTPRPQLVAPGPPRRSPVEQHPRPPASAAALPVSSSTAGCAPTRPPPPPTWIL